MLASVFTFWGLFFSLDKRYSVATDISLLGTMEAEQEQNIQVYPDMPIEVVLPDGDTAVYPSLEDAEIISGISKESIEYSIKQDTVVGGHTFFQDTTKRYMSDSTVLFEGSTQ